MQVSTFGLRQIPADYEMREAARKQKDTLEFVYIIGSQVRALMVRRYLGLFIWKGGDWVEISRPVSK